MKVVVLVLMLKVLRPTPAEAQRHAQRLQAIEKAAGACLGLELEKTGSD